MNEIVIRAERLRKSYKLYASPRHRLLEILGLNRSGAGVHWHPALCDITFSIRRGEKVAVIGRNGAGKSTLLKLVTQVIAPTSGVLEVRGETRALLSIGTGFHPEFTGRQNAEAYLASLGFKGAKLHDLIEQAIEFAEIEDYADRPLKTYSTGMGMRLMFAAATMIKPQLLVIDEVLGVGDAYFQQKSFQHISEICAAGETTLMLVTHDVYSASQLCNRMLWIDQGRLLIDDEPEVVVRAYQDSIREQEERRLRAKALAVRTGARQGSTFKRRILVDVQSNGNRPPAAPLHIAALSLLVGGVQIASCPMADRAFGGDGVACLVAEGSNWGEPEWIEGRLARALRSYGSPFHKVTAAFHLDIDDCDLERLGARIACHSTSPGAFTVQVHAEDFTRSLGALALEAGRWCDVTLGGSSPAAGAAESLSPPRRQASQGAEERAGAGASASAQAEPAFAADRDRDPHAMAAALAHTDGLAGEAFAQASGTLVVAPSLNIDGRYGTGDVELLGLRALDEEGRERHIFPAGSPVTFLLHYRLRRHDLAERLTIVLACKREGLSDVARLICQSLHFDARARREGVVLAHMPRLPLGAGRYALTALVAREGYYNERQTLFFTINPGVYDVRVGLLDIEIEDTSQLYRSTGAVLDAEWTFA
jgi:ABC-type polysaccharide/polyol phosphate transport system ATPase subunit